MVYSWKVPETVDETQPHGLWDEYGEKITGGMVGVRNVQLNIMTLRLCQSQDMEFRVLPECPYPDTHIGIGNGILGDCGDCRLLDDEIGSVDEYLGIDTAREKD